MCRVNCSFFFKIGACRHGERCSRLHNKPTFSQTILLQNLYLNPQNSAQVADSAFGMCGCYWLLLCMIFHLFHTMSAAVVYHYVKSTACCWMQCKIFMYFYSLTNEMRYIVVITLLAIFYVNDWLEFVFIDKLKFLRYIEATCFKLFVC